MYLFKIFLATQEVSVMPAGNHEIKCMACGLNCLLKRKDKMERSLCGEKKFSVWPDKNYF
jgi:hypothetical protein